MQAMVEAEWEVKVVKITASLIAWHLVSSAPHQKPIDNNRYSLQNPVFYNTKWASAEWDLHNVTFADVKVRVEQAFEGHRNDFPFYKKYRDEHLKSKSAIGYYAAAYASVCFAGHQKGLRVSYKIAEGMPQFYYDPYHWITTDSNLPLTKEVIWLRIVIQPMTGAWKAGSYLAAKRFLKSFPDDELVKTKYYLSMTNVLLAPRFNKEDKPLEIPDEELRSALKTALERANKFPNSSSYVGVAGTLFSFAGIAKNKKEWYVQGIDLNRRATSIACLDEYDRKANEASLAAIRDQEDYLKKHF